MVSRDLDLSVRRQCKLLSLVRSGFYYSPKGESAENLRFMEIIHCLAGHACMPEKGQAVP
jgi:putative transposase